MAVSPRVAGVQEAATLICPHPGGSQCGRVAAIRGGQGGGPGGPTTKNPFVRLMDSPHEIGIISKVSTASTPQGGGAATISNNNIL